MRKCSKKELPFHSSSITAAIRIARTNASRRAFRRRERWGCVSLCGLDADDTAPN